MSMNNSSSFFTECIAKALIELLKEKPLSAISVSEITQKAGVSRMTYYRNFTSKEDILEKYINSIIGSYHNEVYSHAKHAAYIRYENVLLGFEYFRRYNDLAACLLTNNLGWYIRDAIISSELGLSLVSENDRQSRYLFIAYANTLFGIMSEWVISGMQDDPEILSKMICDIYQDKLRRY